MISGLSGLSGLSGIFGGTVALPTVSSFTPTIGGTGTTTVITGTNFTGATAVKINGVNVTSFTVDSATQITATVSSSNTSGTVSVTNAGGTGTSAGTFYFMTSLSLWLRNNTGLFQDSAGTTPATADTDPIGRWADQSSGGNNCTQGTAARRPILKLAVQNGKNVVRFDGVDDGLRPGSRVWFPSKRGTIFVVFQTSTTTSKNVIGTYNISGNDSTQFQYSYKSNTVGHLWYDGVSATLSSTTGTGWLITCIVRDGDTNVRFYRNATTSSNVTVGNNQLGNFVLGIATDGSIQNENLAGDYGEIIMCDAALADSDVGGVITYLNGLFNAF